MCDQHNIHSLPREWLDETLERLTRPRVQCLPEINWHQGCLHELQQAAFKEISKSIGVKK